jgi:acetyltransferase
MSYTIERYPTQLIEQFALADGRRVTLRPVLPQDAEMEQALVRSLSALSRYQRFFAPIRELPAGWAERLTQIDYRQHQALIAETFVGNDALAVAEARYVTDASGSEGEFAIVVADDWQHRGLATKMLCSLMRHAADSGLQRLFGDVLATNRAMLALAQSLGFRALRHPDGGAQVLRVQFDFVATANSGITAGRPCAAVTAAAAY